MLLMLFPNISINAQSKKNLRSKTKDSVFGKVKVKNFTTINSKDLDYSAVVVNDGIVFTSTRPHADGHTKKHRSYKKKLSSLFLLRIFPQIRGK